MLGRIAAKDYMAANLITFQPTDDIFSAVHKLIENRISGAPVVDEHGNLLGMLSERDCVKIALDAEYYGEPGGQVGEFMTRTVETVDAETSVLEVAERFMSSPFRRYPVMQDNRLVGQISIRDVLRALEVLSAPEAHAKL